MQEIKQTEKEKQNDIGRKVTGGLIWKLLELGGTQGIQFVVSVILARIMEPEEFGTIGLITIFITIASTFVQSGFATALIQRKDIDDSDYSSVFWISLVLAAVMYALLFFTAPAIARYYDTAILTRLLRVTGIILFPGAVVSVQTACISRNLQFRKLFTASLIAVIISGAAAVILALSGFGVWAISAQQIIFYLALMAVLLFVTDWKIAAVFRPERIKILASFGWKILVAGLIDTIWTNIYGLVIGKRFSQAELGGYNRGEQFPRLIASNLSSAVQSVMLPAYSRLQDDPAALSGMLKSTIRCSAFFLFPMMWGLIACAEPAVRLILTDKWLFCVPYLRIFCISYLFWPVHTSNLQAMNALGRSDLFLKLEIIKKISGITLLIISIRYGIITILALRALNECICAFINAFPNGKLLRYGFGKQCLDMLPALFCSLVMCGVVFALSFTGLEGVVLLIVQIAAGCISYLILSVLFNRADTMKILEAVKKQLHIG